MASFWTSLLLLSGYAAAQLSGAVGPTTSTASKKAKKTCSVLDYGAKADGSTDLGPALTAAWNACASGGLVLIPSGNYAMATWVTLSKGNGVAVQWDGVVTRTGTAGGNMVAVSGGSDIEIFSSTGKGAIQGNGYIIHQTGSLTGARFFRFTKTTNFSLHDLLMADCPSFSVVLDTASNAELYNMAIVAGDHGGLDGIDVWGTNVHVHDVMVTNKDECVTVKSPSNGILVEQIYCNWSGGCAIGSLGAGTAIQNVEYSKIYTQNSNQAMMIKSNGGDGYAKSMTFSNFIVHNNAYTLNIDQAWTGQTPVAGNGVALSDIKFDNWKGDCANGNQRGPIQFKCDDITCNGMSVTNFAVWTAAGSSEKYICNNAYGSGGCLKSGSGGTYSTTQTISSAPAGYSAATMPWDRTTSLGFTSPIAIPVMPSYFFPGTTPLKPLANGSGSSVGAASGATSTLKTTTTANKAPATSTAQAAASVTAASGSGSCASLYGQCGGTGFSGPTCCSSGTCTKSNDYYSQCL